MEFINVVTSNSMYVGGIVLFVIALAGFIFEKYNFGSKVFVEKVVKFMTKAEYGKLAGNALAEHVARFRNGTLDERMVLVLANVIEQIPGAKLLYTVFPKNSVINYLNKKVQGIFDTIEVALKGHVTYTEETFDIASFAGEISNIGLQAAEVEQVTNAVKDLKEVQESLSTLKPYLEYLPKLIEIAKALEKASEKVKK